MESLATNSLSPNSDITIAGAGKLDLHNFSQSIGSLAGSGPVVNTAASGTNTFTLGGSNSSANFTGSISSAATLNLLKIGTGTQVLSGASSYIGSTTVNAGTLTLDYGGSTTSSSFTAATGATLNVNQTVPVGAALTADGNINVGNNTGTGILARSISALNIGSNGVTTIGTASAPTNRTVLLTSALNITSGGTLDLKNNDLIVHGGSHQ